MIEIPFSNGSIHRVKNNWSELSPDQFLDVLDLISLFFSGQLSIRHVSGCNSDPCRPHDE